MGGRPSNRARRQILIVTVVLLLATAGSLVAINQFFKVRTAHSSFENYYAFRGCQELLSKTATAATCRLSSGKVIKIVKVGDKWYLDGDLPVCWFGRYCW